MRITTLALALIAIACGKSSEITSPSPTGLAAAVVGTWNLTQGCGGIVYLCHPADSLNVPNRVVFHTDGTTDLYRGGETTPTRGTFAITASKTDSLRAGTVVLTPGLEGATDTLTLNFSIEGELLLAEPCCDRLAYTFARPFGPD
jgi:hypothetical protein